LLQIDDTNDLDEELSCFLFKKGEKEKEEEEEEWW